MKYLTAAALICAAQTVCAQEDTARFGPEDAPREMIVRSTTDIAVFGPVISAFLTHQPGLAISYEQWGSNDLFDLSKSDCAAGYAGADIVISSGVHQMVQLVNDACAQPHRTAETAALPPELIWRDELWGVTREPAVMVYNRALVPADEVPISRFDLLDLLRPDQSRYAGRVATYDIEESGLGFLFAFVDSEEATTFGALLELLGRTKAVATCCSSEIIDGVASGKYLVAYNVLGSYALARAAHDDRLGVIVPDDYTLLLSRAVMVPKAAKRPEDAFALLDFLLSAAGKAALQKALLIVPMDDKDGGLVHSAESVVRPIQLAPRLLVTLDQQKREGFIRRWRETFPKLPPDRGGSE